VHLRPPIPESRCDGRAWASPAESVRPVYPWAHGLEAAPANARCLDGAP
jgi:hypothetical protein